MREWVVLNPVHTWQIHMLVADDGGNESGDVSPKTIK